MGGVHLLLPASLCGVATGILLTDLGIGPGVAVAAMAGAGGLAVGLIAGARGVFAIVLGVALLGMSVGTWRQELASEPPDGTEATVAQLVDGSEHDIVGVVADDPRPRADRLQLVLSELTATIDGQPVRMSDRLLVWLPRGIDATSGDRLIVRTRVELAEDFDGFAYREYLARQGVGGIARARSAQVANGEGGPSAAMAALRGALLHGINSLVPEPEAALGAGILLGVRAAIAPEVNDAFATAGLTHVVAISGWNIAIVAALVMALVRPLERRPGGRWTTALVAASVVGGYVILTGASPSVVRAALMAGAMLVGRLGGSRAHAASALGLAALVMLLAAPSVLWDVGFQLSLLATAGLIWFGRSIEQKLSAWPGWIREPVSLTMAAQLTTLPVILVNFERLSLVAPIANVLVVPLVPLAMLFGALTAVGGLVLSTVPLGPVGDAIGWFLGGSSWLVLLAMISVGHLVASVPMAAVDVSVAPPIAIAWLPILALASWAMRDQTPHEETVRVPDEAMTGTMAAIGRVLRPLPAAGLLVVTLLGVTLIGRPDGRLHVTTLDIGQGDAILVQAPDGATMLVDGGPDPELTLRRLGANMGFFDRRIDLLVLSHPHQDHVAGLIEVLDRFRVGAVLHAGIAFENTANDRLLTDAAAAGVPLALARAGQIWQLGAGASVEVLYPTDTDASAALPDGDINNGSVVLVVRHGGFSALLTGDAEEPIESLLISRGLLDPVDLLKVGHHGSISSTTPGLLDATRPTVATISSGEGNEYGHPAPETLAALASHPGIGVLRTDTDGDIEVVSDGASYQVRTDQGWSASRPVHGGARTGSIGPWPFPTDPPRSACSTSRDCPMGSSLIPRASLALPWPPPSSWRPLVSRSTSRWSRQRRCCTISTRSRSGAPGASTGSSARAAWRSSATKSSPCRSPPIRSPPCSTRIASRSAGRRSWSPWPTGTWPRHT